MGSVSPTVTDRLIQQPLLQVLRQILDPALRTDPPTRDQDQVWFAIERCWNGIERLDAAAAPVRILESSCLS